MERRSLVAKNTVTFKLNKLVRDKVYDDMVRAGQEIDSYVLPDEKVEQALLDKLAEELDELRSGDDDSPADLGSVFLAYAKLKGFTVNSLLKAINDRDEKRGAFDYKRFVESVTLPADDPWVSYYRKDPDKYPEVNAQ